VRERPPIVGGYIVDPDGRRAEFAVDVR